MKFYKDRRRRRGWAEGIDQVKQTFFYSIIRITLACLSLYVHPHHSVLLSSTSKNLLYQQ